MPPAIQVVHPMVHRYTLLGNPLTLGCISFKNNNLNINHWITFKRRVSTLFPSNNPLSALLHDLLLICLAPPWMKKLACLACKIVFRGVGVERQREAETCVPSKFLALSFGCGFQLPTNSHSFVNLFFKLFRSQYLT